MSDTRPTSPRSGTWLAVLGSFLGSDPVVAADAGGAPAVDRAGGAPAGAPALPPLLASEASTCFSVMILGGFEVTMVAVN